MTITVNNSNTSYVNVSAPWRLGDHSKEQSEEEKRRFAELMGKVLQINNKTFEMLSEIEQPKITNYKGLSFDSSISKVNKFYIDNHHQNKVIEKLDTNQIKDQYKRKKGDVFNPATEPDEVQSIHMELKTWEDLEHIRESFFPPIAELSYYSDPILQVCIKYYMDNNNPDYRKQQQVKKNK